MGTNSSGEVVASYEFAFTKNIRQELQLLRILDVCSARTAVEKHERLPTYIIIIIINFNDLESPRWPLVKTTTKTTTI